MQRFPFHTAYTQTRELYGLELNPDEFESLGLTAWNMIGNKEYRLYKFQEAPLQDENYAYYIDLPCNCDYIEAITADYEDYQKTTPTTLAGNNQNGWIEGYIESRKYNTDFLYSSGKFIKYQQVGNRIYLADRFNKVNVLYKGVMVDKEGLPSISNAEIEALAAFCVFADTRKKAIMTRDNSLFQQAQYLENNWKMKCTQARVPEYINQNEMDQILNASTSWDRKRYGRSFKSVR